MKSKQDKQRECTVGKSLGEIHSSRHRIKPTREASLSLAGFSLGLKLAPSSGGILIRIPKVCQASCICEHSADMARGSIVVRRA
jgi:hypothetical protein